MPDNPIVPDLLKHAGQAHAAQAKLREAMAAVAAELAAHPTPPAAPGKPA